MSNIGKNSSFLRAINKKSIIGIIRNEIVSRSDIARITGLTKPAVSSIVDHLIETGYVEELGTQEISRGRRPEMLSLKKDSYYSLGIGVYRDKCIIGISDFSGEVITGKTVIIQSLPPIIAVNVMSEEIKKIQKQMEIPDEKILGLGISIPGPVNTIEGQVMNPPNFNHWHNFNIVEQFKKHFSMPIYVENDATAYALMENLLGYGKDFKNYLMLVFVDGVGSAQIINGVPFKGQFGLNSEFGHVSIDYKGEKCQCGNHGCLELYTSIPNIISKAKSEGIKVETWDDIVDRALEQDQDCLRIVHNQASLLAFSIENIVNIFAPEAVILSGKIQYKSDLLLSLIKNDLYTKFSSKRVFEPKVLISKLSQQSDVAAATSIVLNYFFFSETDDESSELLSGI